MAAFVTDQFRILNASNFVDSISDTNNSYFIFLGLPNPTTQSSVGTDAFGRNSNWNDTANNANMPPDPYDNFDYLSFYQEAGLFGKRVTKDNARRVIRKIEWKANGRYDMYRHDYSRDNLAPASQSNRLYNADYYVINKDFRVYVCIDNGTQGINPNVPTSKFEPLFTDTQPNTAGNDGYVWKYLFTVAPSDIIKFDSTEYIVVPNDWSTESGEIERIRNTGDSKTNLNGQLQKVYIENGGTQYSDATGVPIIGDGQGATVNITTTNGVITGAEIATGGYGYTFGFVDLKGTSGTAAKLIPIIPPSRGHGYDIYKELGTDRVLLYARFDDSTRDFPTNTEFAQVGILKNPTQFSSDSIYTEQSYSGLYALRFDPSTFPTQTDLIGKQIRQQNSQGQIIAKGWVASYDSDTGVLKYITDRANYFGTDQTDNADNQSNLSDFVNNSTVYFGDDSSTATSASIVNTVETITKIGTTNLDTTLVDGLGKPEINKSTGEILYIDNRRTVVRNLRQKEDVKIILEF